MNDATGTHVREATMIMTRRTLLGTLAVSLPAVSLSARAEDAWPSRLVRLISPYGPGGSNDISLRLFADELGRNLHQQFIVENKPGAGTRIANDLVAHAPGDGYTPSMSQPPTPPPKRCSAS